MKLNKYKYEILTITVILIIIFFIYPRISPYISHNLKVDSSDLIVNGYYYSINMDQLTKLEVKSDKVIMTGFDVFFLKQSDEFQVVRHIPSEFLPILGQDSSWILLDSTFSEENFTIRTFENQNSKAQVKVYLPFWNSSPNWYAFKLNDNRELFVLSSANFKRDENVYLAYILVKQT